MGLMASGAQFVKGTFTTPDSGTTYTLDIGKSFSKYLYYIEMTDDSKTALHNSGQTSAKMFALIGAYPKFSFNNNDTNGAGYLSYRVIPSSNTIDRSANAIPTSIDESSITFGLAAITGGANNMYRGYTYNYYIVEIK